MENEFLLDWCEGDREVHLFLFKQNLLFSADSGKLYRAAGYPLVNRPDRSEILEGFEFRISGIVIALRGWGCKRCGLAVLQGGLDESFPHRLSGRADAAPSEPECKGRANDEHNLGDGREIAEIANEVSEALIRGEGCKFPLGEDVNERALNPAAAGEDPGAMADANPRADADKGAGNGQTVETLACDPDKDAVADRGANERADGSEREAGDALGLGHVCPVGSLGFNRRFA
jgi:hypothetical protein